MSTTQIQLFKMLERLSLDEERQATILPQANETHAQKFEQLEIDVSMQSLYIVNADTKKHLAQVMNVKQAMITKLLNRPSQYYQILDFDSKKEKAIKLLDAENKFISAYFTHENKPVELVYDSTNGYINATRFGKQFNVSFKFWYKEYNGEDCIKWFNSTYSIEDKNGQSVKSAYLQNEANTKYEFHRGFYLHPELFMFYASFVHPILGVLTQRFLGQLKIIKLAHPLAKCIDKNRKRPRRQQRDTSNVTSEMHALMTSTPTENTIDNDAMNVECVNRGSQTVSRHDAEEESSTDDDEIEIRANKKLKTIEPTDKEQEELVVAIDALTIDTNKKATDKVISAIGSLAIEDDDDDLIFDTSSTGPNRRQRNNPHRSMIDENVEASEMKEQVDPNRYKRQPKVTVVARSNIKYDDDDDMQTIRIATSSTNEQHDTSDKTSKKRLF